MRVIMTSRTDCGQLPVGGRLGGQGGRLTQEAGAAVAASQVYEKMGCAGLFTTFCTNGTGAKEPINAAVGSAPTPPLGALPRISVVPCNK